MRTTKKELAEANLQTSRALLEAVMALKAIGLPEPLPAPDAETCAVIAQQALNEITEIMEGRI
jgi:hypothetical protein